MSIFQDIIKLWKSSDLLSQAWDESYDMLILSNSIFNHAVEFLRDGADNKTIKALKKRDSEINEYQKSVRKKVVTHFSIKQNVDELPNGLILLNMVVDIERIGDYTKNILDLALTLNKQLNVEHFSKELHAVENEIIERFDKTVAAIKDHNIEIAKELMSTYKHRVPTVCDTIVSDCISGELFMGDEGKTASITLYARYLKRIGAHLKNITTILINPFDAVGYKK